MQLVFPKFASVDAWSCEFIELLFLSAPEINMHPYFQLAHHIFQLLDIMSNREASENIKKRREL